MAQENSRGCDGTMVEGGIGMGQWLDIMYRTMVEGRIGMGQWLDT